MSLPRCRAVAKTRPPPLCGARCAIRCPESRLDRCTWWRPSALPPRSVRAEAVATFLEGLAAGDPGARAESEPVNEGVLGGNAARCARLRHYYLRDPMLMPSIRVRSTPAKRQASCDPAHPGRDSSFSLVVFRWEGRVRATLRRERASSASTRVSKAAISSPNVS